MYLKALKLHGFKSFADPTTLRFDTGGSLAGQIINNAAVQFNLTGSLTAGTAPLTNIGGTPLLMSVEDACATTITALGLSNTNKVAIITISGAAACPC